MKHLLAITAYAVLFIAGTEVCTGTNLKSLKYLGNAFVKLTTSEGKIIYIDPYAFSQPDSADIILVTHEHNDHNDVTRVIPKASCTVIRKADAIKEGVYQSFTIGNISITAVPAYNQYHLKDSGVGFVVEFDGIKIYHGGGTGKIPEMTDIAAKGITYALWPLTPGPEIMTEAAAMIHAKRDIPMHTIVSLDSAYNTALVARFTSPNKLVVLPNKTIMLNANGALHNGTMLHVPEEYPTIQSAIDMAKHGDTVLVSEGTYKERIRYNGKNIVVASRYIITHDHQSIRNTIIDATMSSAVDSNSTVSFLNGEDSTAVLEGFTITGGSGTKYFFPNGTGTSPYQEGAGIILHFSSATIRDNIITENVMKPVGSTPNGGGGGIAAMYSNPHIYRNVIFSNTAGYAGGIVLNWSAGKISNNIVYRNSAVGQFGAGGIMVWESPKDSTVVQNNTVIGNSSAAAGGGFRIRLKGGTSVAPLVRNNLIWGNRQTSGTQVDLPHHVSFCNIEDYNGGTNISSTPQCDTNFILSASSPCIDAGDSTGMCGDNEEPLNAGSALFPSQGTLRNDIGAYGGPLAKSLPRINIQDMALSSTSFVLTGTKGVTGTAKLALRNLSTAPLKINEVGIKDTVIFSLSKNCSERVFGILEKDTLTLAYSPDTSGIFYDTIKIVYESPISGKPPYSIITIKLTVHPTTGADESEAMTPGEFRLHPNYPNPFNPATVISYRLPAAGHVSLKIYDLLGRETATLVNEKRNAGNYTLEWNAEGLPSGIYFCVLESGTKRAVQKMLLMK